MGATSRRSEVRGVVAGGGGGAGGVVSVLLDRGSLEVGFTAMLHEDEGATCAG